MPSRHLDTLFARHGEALVITRYTQTGTDSYGDPTFDETTQTVFGLVERYGNRSIYTRSAEGEDPDIDVRVFLRDSVTVDDASAATPKAARIERTATGETYRVKAVFDEGTGLFEIGGEQLD